MIEAETKYSKKRKNQRELSRPRIITEPTDKIAKWDETSKFSDILFLSRKLNLKAVTRNFVIQKNLCFIHCYSKFPHGN